MLRQLPRLPAVALICASLAMPGIAGAALIDRGGGLIFDTDRNITWLQDANYAKTSGYDADGLMNWNTAAAWADQLVYGGSSNWRLPTTTDIGLFGCNNTMAGDECANIPGESTSELAHLFYTELGNLSGYFENGNPRPGGGLTQVGPFTNLQVYQYWGGTANIPQNWAYGFDFVYGVNFANELRNTFYAIAVSDGDVGGAAVPLPAAGWLGGSAFLAALVRARRRAQG